jgi:DNA-binding Lrp family transcriptional regulator
MGAYVSMGPMTDAEMASYLKLERTTVNARRNELVEAGRVVKCGTKINARTRVKNVLWGVR